MNFTLRFVFAATFLSLMFDGTAAHAQQSRRHRRGGQNNYAISQQILARFLANERAQHGHAQQRSCPDLQTDPQRLAKPQLYSAPRPRNGRSESQLLRHDGLNQPTTGKFRQGAVSGAKSLYNAHNAAAGYALARFLPPGLPDTSH